jgi:hypothetical protein
MMCCIDRLRSWSVEPDPLSASAEASTAQRQDELMSDAFGTDEMALVAYRIDTWLMAELASNELLVAVDRDEELAYRWYVRMRGEAKEFTTIWLTLGQRTLAYETYVMPAPQENAAQLYEQVLRRNVRLVGCHFAIGAEDAVFLVGSLPLVGFSEAELDRVVGTTYATVEASFRTLLGIGFASRFPSPS